MILLLNDQWIQSDLSHTSPSCYCDLDLLCVTFFPYFRKRILPISLSMVLIPSLCAELFSPNFCQQQKLSKCPNDTTPVVECRMMAMWQVSAAWDPETKHDSLETWRNRGFFLKGELWLLGVSTYFGFFIIIRHPPKNFPVSGQTV